MVECKIDLLFSPVEEPSIQSHSWKSFSLAEDKNKNPTLVLLFRTRKGGGEKNPFRVRMKRRRLHGLLICFSKGLYGTWADRNEKKNVYTKSTAVSSA